MKMILVLSIEADTYDEVIVFAFGDRKQPRQEWDHQWLMNNFLHYSHRVNRYSRVWYSYSTNNNILSKSPYQWRTVVVYRWIIFWFHRYINPSRIWANQISTNWKSKEKKRWSMVARVIRIIKPADRVLVVHYEVFEDIYPGVPLENIPRSDWYTLHWSIRKKRHID